MGKEPGSGMGLPCGGADHSGQRAGGLSGRPDPQSLKQERERRMCFYSFYQDPSGRQNRKPCDGPDKRQQWGGLDSAMETLGTCHIRAIVGGRATGKADG